MLLKIVPFTILHQINPVADLLNSHHTTEFPHHFMRLCSNPTITLCLFLPQTLMPGLSITPPPPLDVTQQIYRVELILDSRGRGGRLEHLVDWERYGPEQQSWVARDDILDPTLLRDFHSSHQNYLGRWRGPWRGLNISALSPLLPFPFN